MLEVTSLSYAAGQHRLLSHVSIRAHAASITVLLGPNGAGKTTLLKTIMGLYQSPQPDQELHHNLIHFNNTLINHYTVSQRVACGLAYLAQQSSLFIDMSVHDNLMLVYEYHDYWHKKDKALFMSEMHNWLKLVSLEERLYQKAGSLSGGQKRKLEVARTLLMHPRMILLDEPFAGVDPKSMYELKDIFSHITQQDIGILISDHHVDQLFSIAQQVFVIIGGKVVTSGTIHDILNNEETKTSYLGTRFYEEMITKFT